MLNPCGTIGQHHIVHLRRKLVLNGQLRFRFDVFRLQLLLYCDKPWGNVVYASGAADVTAHITSLGNQCFTHIKKRAMRPTNTPKLRLCTVRVNPLTVDVDTL